MSWLLFLDESGHYHQSMPYEVRGGIALHASELWAFVSDMQRLEVDSFGVQLHTVGKELKGSSLLDRKRYRLAAQLPDMDGDARRKHARSLLQLGSSKKSPTKLELTGYGQACLAMARGVFQLLRDHKARLFAAVVPRNFPRPAAAHEDGYLRKDQVYLFERYFYFLEEAKEHGLLVLDEVDKAQDKRFVRRLEAYFTRTSNGRHRTAWIVPVPLFVASDLAYGVQAADLCIYCVNTGFRLPTRGMDAPTRQEIADEFGPWLSQLQYRGEAYKDGEVYSSYGIVYEPDPYNAARDAHEKRGNAPESARRQSRG